MADPNWFYSTLAQSSAAIVGLAGGFMVTRVLAQRTDIDSDRTTARALMLNLYSSTVAQRDLAKQVQASIRKVLPIAENTGQLDISLIQVFSHPGNHGQQEIYAVDVDVPKLLRQLADDAKTYQRALEQLARNPERLADQLRTGKDPRSHAPEWLNEQLTEGLSGGTVFETLGRPRQWMRNDWNGRVGQFEDIRVRLASLRTRAAIGSLSGLVGVLAAFLILGVLVPLAYLSARAGSSRISLLIAFGALALLFLLYLANEVRRLTNAMHLEQEFW